MRLILMLVLLCLSLPAAGETIDDLRRENARLRAALDAAEQRIAELEATLGRAEHDNRQLTELAGVRPTGELVQSARARIETVYSEDTGRTTVRSRSEPLKVTAGSAAAHYLTVAYSHAGQAPAGGVGDVKLYIQTSMSGQAYYGQATATLVIDGEPVDLPISDYERRGRHGVAGKGRADRSNETLAIAIPDDVLVRLAGARSLVGQIGQVTFELGPDQVGLFGAIRARRAMGD